MDENCDPLSMLDDQLAEVCLMLGERTYENERLAAENQKLLNTLRYVRDVCEMHAPCPALKVIDEALGEEQS